MGKDDLGDVAEEWFERYLNERGYTFEAEPDLDTGKFADRLVSAGEHLVMCEVKSFAGEGIFSGTTFQETGTPGIRISQPRARTQAKMLQPLRKQIKKAAAQLKPLQDRAWPLMVVLANPMNAPVPMEPTEVIAAMYGDLEGWGSLDEEGGLDLQWAAGHNGQLTSTHSYISAVAMLHHRHYAQDWVNGWFDANRNKFARFQDLMAALRQADADSQVPTGDYVYLDVFETISDDAVPLPRDIFNGFLDHRFIPTPQGDGLALMAPPEP
ncbi:MAG TPA: hypothetical protein VLW50_13910 [Streptosporangiaceae bacterium]|nr:hypothetical protein [Streptosporangiaceae bacterium]